MKMLKQMWKTYFNTTHYGQDKNPWHIDKGSTGLTTLRFKQDVGNNPIGNMVL